MADRDGERVRLVRGRRLGLEREQHANHPSDLALVRPAVTTHRLLDARRRVLGACDPLRCGRDEHGAACLPDEERDAGVGPDERLLQRDGVRLVLPYEVADPVEDRPEPVLRALSCAGRPASVGEGCDTPLAFVDDPVPARSRPWIDAEDFHVQRVRSASDVPAGRQARDPAPPRAYTPALVSVPLDANLVVIAGVPVYWAHGFPGSRPFAGLIFRVGQADETLVTAGTTHLVEHLALPARSTPGLDVNGQVDGTSTLLWYSGETDDVIGELRRSVELIRALPRWRFEQERSILQTEAENRSTAFVQHAHALRFGSRGFGLAGHPEYGLDHVDLRAAQAWADSRFCRSQCAVVLTFPPPDALGEVLEILEAGTPVPPPEPTAIPYLEFPSACPAGLAGYVGGSYIAPRGYETTVGQRLLEDRLRETLRYRGGLTYSVSTTYEPLGATLAIATVLVDAMESNTEAVRNGLIATWESLARAAPSSAEFDAVIRDFSRDPTDNGGLIGFLLYHAHSHRIGHETRTRAEELETLQALTPGAVAETLRASYDSLLLVQPPSVQLPGGRFKPYPLDSPELIADGRRFKRSGLPFRRTGEEQELVVSEKGVTLFGEGYGRSVFADDTTAVLQYQDGIRRVWGGDGFSIVVDPAIWRGGGDLPALVDRLGDGVVIDMTATPPIFEDRELQSAVSAFDGGDCEKAFGLFSQGTDRHPDDPVAWAYRSAAALGLDRHRESLNAATRACAIEPDYAWAQRLRSKGLWWSGRIDDALDAARAALALGVSDDDGLSDFAFYFAEAGEDEEANTVVELMEALHPDSPLTWFAKGWSAQSRGAFDLAEPALERVVELNPEDSYAQNNLGLVLLQKGQTEQALEAFDRAIKLSADNMYAPWNRAIALALLGRQSEADRAREALERHRLRLATESLDRDPYDRDALAERTDRLTALGELEEARDAARQHVERYADDFSALVSLAELELHLGDNEHAHAVLHQVESLSPTDRTALALRLELEARGSIRDESRAALACALAEHPNDSRLLGAQAVVALADDARTLARAVVGRLLERAPLECCPHGLLGLLALREGDEPGARAALAASRARTPTCFVADDLERILKNA